MAAKEWDRDLEDIESDEEDDQNDHHGDGLERDSMILLRYLSEEVWLLVINAMDDPQDVENAFNSSLYLRHLLLPKRSQFLFPNVYKLLVKEFEYWWIQTPSKSAETFPWNDMGASSYIPQILNLRKVCKTWNRGIENFYENLPHHRKMKHEQKVVPLTADCLNDVDTKSLQIGSWTQHLEFSDHDPEEIIRFKERFEKTHFPVDTLKNPFLGRFLTFRCQLRRTQRLIWGDANISTLLQDYGHHIWYCVLDTEDNFNSRLEYYHKLQELLQFMPNLKVLDIRYSRRSAYHVGIRGGAQSFRFGEVQPNALELSRLRAEINVSGLPHFANLTALRTKNLPTPIFNQLVKKNSHVSVLEVDRVGAHGEYDIYTVALPNLKDLLIKICSEEDFQRLEGPEANWPLRKLHLDFHQGESPIFGQSRIFSLLQKANWAGSLRSVMIHFPRIAEEGFRTFTGTLDLPRVKRLKILLHGAFYLDFILGVRSSLESLKITVRCNYLRWRLNKEELHQSQGRTIKFVDSFHQDKKRVQRSEANLWKTFRKLERFDFQLEEWGEPGERVRDVNPKIWHRGDIRRRSAKN